MEFREVYRVEIGHHRKPLRIHDEAREFERRDREVVGREAFILIVKYCN